MTRSKKRNRIGDAGSGPARTKGEIRAYAGLQRNHKRNLFPSQNKYPLVMIKDHTEKKSKPIMTNGGIFMLKNEIFFVFSLYSICYKNNY